MPKIVTTALPTTVAPMNREYNESPTSGYEFWKTRNALILTTWFNQNQDKLSLVAEQLTKKLGEEKFKNMTLSNPTISWDEVRFSKGNVTKLYLTPKVTFNLAAKEGYALAQDSATSVTLTIRVLYKDSNPEVNVFQTQGSSPSAAPSGSSVDDANVKAKVNVYLNYTGPSIVLDEALPTVGGKENTSINGTSNVDGAFNNAFRGNPTSGLLFTNRYPNPLLKSVINYVNKFDPKYRATFVTNSRDGVTITKVEKTKELRPGTLDDLVKNRNIVFLQQMKNDTESVYLPVTALTNDKWLNTVLVRIPLTKFVRPISVFQATTAAPQDAAQASEGQGSQPDQTGQTA
ncbi:hemagglutinin [Mycoplasmopsis synoviae]|uniref:hemagglutinin n=1 Tax=Mycoplasmopsis synoviae TaxID=2109 RepID=UPI001CE132BD|nr:hemagglutinin [Mycoplasmopsis synoviae]